MRGHTRAKQNGGLLLREKQARQLSTCLSKPLTEQRCSHRLIEPLNEKSQIAQEYGLLQADARQQLLMGLRSCGVNTTSRQGIKQLGIVARRNPRPPPLNDSPAILQLS